MQNESSCCPAGYCPIAASSLLSPLGVIVQGNTGVAQLSILMKILTVCVFLPPSDLQVLSHRSIATHLTYGRTTDLCFLAKVTHSVPCPLVQFKYSPLAQMLDTWDTARKPLKYFTWKQAEYLNIELPFHNLEQRNSKEKTPSYRTAGKKVWVNQPQTHFCQKLSKPRHLISENEALLKSFSIGLSLWDFIPCPRALPIRRPFKHCKITEKIHQELLGTHHQMFKTT